MDNIGSLIAALLLVTSSAWGQESLTYNQLSLSPTQYADKKVVVIDVSMSCGLQNQYDHVTFGGIADHSIVVKALKDVVIDHGGVAFVTLDNLAQTLNSLFSNVRAPEYPCNPQPKSRRTVRRLDRPPIGPPGLGITPLNLFCNLHLILVDNQKVWVAEVARFEFANGVVVPEMPRTVSRTVLHPSRSR